MTGIDDAPDPLVEVQVAAAVAEAARRTPGVLRLQPGLWGLVQQLARDVWTRLTTQAYPDVAGVEVSIRPDATTVDIALVCDGLRPAAIVAADVQRNVHRAVVEGCSIAPARIAVHVVDIAPPEPGAGISTELSPRPGARRSPSPSPPPGA